MKKRNLKGSVVLNPVPAVLVTCKNSEGKDNVFTVQDRQCYQFLSDLKDCLMTI